MNHFAQTNEFPRRGITVLMSDVAWRYVLDKKEQMGNTWGEIIRNGIVKLMETNADINGCVMLNDYVMGYLNKRGRLVPKMRKGCNYPKFYIFWIVKASGKKCLVYYKDNLDDEKVKMRRMFKRGIHQNIMDNFSFGLEELIPEK